MSILNLIIEMSGEKWLDNETKMETVKSLWVHAVNNSGQFCRWAVCDVTAPSQAMTTGVFESIVMKSFSVVLKVILDSKALALDFFQGV
jgi:hypothetical protein